MNAIVALCHFCELHGPKVLLCVQPKAMDDDLLFEGDVSMDSSSKSMNYCEACRSIPADAPGFVSVEETTGVQFVGLQHPEHPKLFSRLRQACLRSLSQEGLRSEGPTFFGDDINGYVLSYCFFLKDANSRGLQAMYSIILMMMDRCFLLSSWPFIVHNVQNIVGQLQSKAEVVYERDQANCPQRVFRMHSRRVKPSPRSLRILTEDSNIFPKLHRALVWILRSSNRRLVESAFEAAPSEKFDLETPVNFNMAEPKPADLMRTNSFDTKTTIPNIEAASTAIASCLPVVKLEPLQHVRHLYKELERFHIGLDLLYNLVIGNHMIIICEDSNFLSSFIQLLQSLLPNGCGKVKLDFFSEYSQSDTWTYNIVGLTSPNSLPSEQIENATVLSIKLASRCIELTEDFVPLSSVVFSLTSTSPVVTTVPALVSKYKEMLLTGEDVVSDVVFQRCLETVKHDWMHKVKVTFQFMRSSNRTEKDLNKLLQLVGASSGDLPILKYWQTALTKEYRSNILAVALHL